MVVRYLNEATVVAADLDEDLRRSYKLGWHILKSTFRKRINQRDTLLGWRTQCSHIY